VRDDQSAFVQQVLTEPAHTGPAVRLVGVGKQFDGVASAALTDVTLEVARGEFIGLIGLSGSGKSTLLRHINGLHKPTAGSVEVLGVDVSSASGAGLRALRRRVGFVFQQFNLVGRVSVMENVCAGALGSLRGPRYGVLSYPKQVRHDALDQLSRVGLADRAFQRADTLSGGQQQRVAIARMLMQRPELVLADEPVAALDPESSNVVMELLHRISTEDRLTVVCSLHQVDLALAWTTRIVGLRDGRTVLDRTTSGMANDEAMQVYKQVGASDAEVADLQHVDAQLEAALDEHEGDRREPPLAL
jgi:phosphonate transport system ATP-binding protein